MPEWKDKMKGGKADKRSPSDFDKRELEAGRKHEMEHTKDPHKALEIAMDHLEEDPKYYQKLKKIEAAVMDTKEECGSWEAAKQMTSPEDDMVDKPAKIIQAPLKFEKTNESVLASHTGVYIPPLSEMFIQYAIEEEDKTQSTKPPHDLATKIAVDTNKITAKQSSAQRLRQFKKKHGEDALNPKQIELFGEK